MAIKKETTENVAVNPDVFIPFLSEDLSTEWGGVYSPAIVAQRMRYYRPVDRAIDAPEGKIKVYIEPAFFGHFLLAVGGAITSGRYIPMTSASAAFTVGETVTGGSSGFTATVTAVSSEDDYLLTGAFTGTPTDGETITGGSSGSTATLTKADPEAYGHQAVMPQDDIATTYTLEIGYDNEAHRYTGVRFHDITFSQEDNVITAEISAKARCEFIMARVTAITSSGAGAKTITVDQTTGLAASSSVKVYRPGTGFLDFSAASVKTHTVNAVSSETAFTITNLQTSVAVGDLVVIAPQTAPSYTGEKEFTWAGGSTVKIGSTITAALSATPDSIEDFEITVANDIEPKHAANGLNTVHRFPAKMFTKGCEITGKIMRTYTDVTYLDKMRSERQFGMQLLSTAAALPNAADFNYLLDIRASDARHHLGAPDVSEDDLLEQDMELAMFNSSTDGYAMKILLVNENTSY